jgi:hypothetical protein
MATQREAPRFVAVTRVPRGRMQEFEGLIPTLAAAADRARPHLSARWQLLRPDTEEDDSDPASYLFLFFGDLPFDEWDIERICVEALGDEEGHRLAEQIADCIDGEQDVHVFSGEVSAGSPL